MFARSVRVCVVLSVLAVAVAQAQSPYDRVAYWDSNFGTAWAGDGIAVRDALQAAGYTVLNGTELKAWMDARIADKKLSVVVMCRDAVPNTVAETQTATCTIRRYLDAGGKVVWYSDIPFYYQSAPGGANTTWGDNGSVNVLGFAGSSATRDVGAQVTITEAGARWGLTTAWNSTRPTAANVTTDLEILASDRNGAASGWVKHYVPGDTFRGFVRIEDHTGAPTDVANLIAVAEYYEAFTTAVSPVPSDGATDVPRDIALGWTAGEFAATHDVYFGTDSAAVGDASRDNPMDVLAAQGLADVSYAPASVLDYGQTYYWRIDEVNAAPADAIYKGDVWTFTAEPFSYPITNLTATASSVSRPDMGPENTIGNAGLNADDQHSTESTDMWMSAGVLPNWIQYEFDKVYKVDKLWVWNSNMGVESLVGFGAKNVTIEYSADGATWATLENVPEFAQAPGDATYTANTVVDFGGVSAKYVKLTIDMSWSGVPQTGLAEVRFFYVPVMAREPVPVDGATDIELNTVFNWRPGREATSHQVFLGTDSNAVADNLVPAKTVADHSYTAAAMNFGTKYFWKVDEIGDGGTYAGDVWSFTSKEFAAIDDFESYNDTDNCIFDTWVDGYGDNANGSIVGYIDSANGTFGETTIIHGGKQSMPLAYDNSGSSYSETAREFDTNQNWTGNGADMLSLWTQGRPAAYVDDGGAITMSAGGHDIWDNADDFRFAYKTLSSNGSVLVKVESLLNTNAWAKAGVMIRQSLQPDSPFVYMVVSYSSGVSMGWRPTIANTCSSVTQASITAPQWVKLTRTGDVFTAQYSADGKTWTDLKNTDGTIASATVAMTNPVYVGLCLTSHNSAATTVAKMSGVVVSGTVSGQWQQLAIGDDPQLTNDPADMYLTVTDSAGKSATVTSATAALTPAWTQWLIPMSDLSGVSFSKVKKVTIGVGSKGGSPSGAAGMVFIDDIGYGHAAQ